MCTGHQDIFKYINLTYCGTLTIASGTRMPIEGRGIVKFSLLNGSRARLGGVIYVAGLAENLLSLEALHLASFESRSSMRGYKLMKGEKVVAKGRRTGRTTYLDAVRHINALHVGPSVAKMKQHSRLALSADEETAMKEKLIHWQLGHPRQGQFNKTLS